MTVFHLLTNALAPSAAICIGIAVLIPRGSASISIRAHVLVSSKIHLLRATVALGHKRQIMSHLVCRQAK